MNLDGQVFQQRREESALPIRSLSNDNCRYATDVRKRHGTWSGISLSPTTGFEGSLDSPPKRISKNNRRPVPVVSSGTICTKNKTSVCVSEKTGDVDTPKIIPNLMEEFLLGKVKKF